MIGTSSQTVSDENRDLKAEFATSHIVNALTRYCVYAFQQVQPRGCGACSGERLPFWNHAFMKTPLRIFSLALALGCASTVAQAQGGGGGGGRMSMEDRKAKMFEGITLTADQKTKIDTVMAQTAKKQQEMMAGQAAGGPPSPEMREKRMALQAEQMKAIKALLTGDQQSIFDKNMEGMMPRRPGN